MSKKKRPIVRIVNPRDERTYTSEQSAAEYVRRGVAVMKYGGLLFLKGTPRADFVSAAVVKSADTYDPVVHTGLATLACVEGLPVAGDPVKVFVVRSGRKAPRFYTKRSKPKLEAA